MAKRKARPDIISRLMEELIDDQNRIMGGKNKDVPYVIEPPELLGIRRNEEFDALATEAYFGRDPKALLKHLLELKKEYNDRDLSRCGLWIENQIAAVGQINERTNATLRICALFINAEGEDRNAAPTEAQARKKIDDWADAGIPFPFLKSCAATFSDMLAKLYESGSPSSPPPTQQRPRQGA